MIKDKIIKIGSRVIGAGHPPYCIAEVGINHNGDIELAKRMIDMAHEAGADAVKFQTFKAAEFCGDPHQLFSYRSQGRQVTEPMLEMFRRYELSPSAWAELKTYCDEVGITFFSTPQNSTDLELLLSIGVPAIKVGSDDLTNLPLLSEYAANGLPLIISCGMSDISEVHQALEHTGWFDGSEVALLLCTSQYPTPPEDVNIRKLTTLGSTFPGLVLGFSDHTQDAVAASLAVAMGARVFEKHFTLDRMLPGPDHWFSEDPTGLKLWVQTIRKADLMLGSLYIRPTAAEQEMRVLARRSVVALTSIGPGEVLSETNIGLRRPGDGLPPARIAELYGLKAAKPIDQGQKINLKDVGG